MKTNKLKQQQNRLSYIKKRAKEVETKWGIKTEDILGRRKSLESFAKTDKDYEAFKQIINDKVYRAKDRQQVIKEYNAYNKRIIEKNATEIKNVRGEKFTKEQVAEYRYKEYLANRALKEIKERYENDQVTKDYMDTLTINLTQKHRNLERLSKARYDKEIDELDKIDSNYIDYLINEDRKFLKDIFTKGAMRNLDEKFLKGIEYAIDNASPVAIKNYISEHKRTGIKLAYQMWENVWDDTLTDEYLMSIGNSLIAQLT